MFEDMSENVYRYITLFELVVSYLSIISSYNIKIELDAKKKKK